jgi:capsular polysaccharide biosynthesis protein
MQAAIGSFWDVLWRRRVVVVVILVVGLSAALYARKVLPREYVSTSTILTINENSERNLSADIPMFITSSDFLGKVANRLGVQDSVSSIQKAVKAKGRGDALLISYKSPDPQKAVAFSNAIADEIPLYYHAVVSGRFAHNVQALRSELEQQRKRLARLNARLAKSTSGNASAAGEKPLDQVSTRLQMLQQAREQAVAQLTADRATASADALREPAVAAVVQAERIAADAVYREMQGTVAKDHSALAAQEASFTSSYPGLTGLRKKVDRERDTLGAVGSAAAHRLTNASQTNANLVVAKHHDASVLAGDRARLSALDSAITRTASQLSSAAYRDVDISSLQLERGTAQQAYLTLSTKLTGALADHAQASSLGSVVVVDHALQANLTAYGAKTFLIIEILAALGLAIAGAFIAENLDPRLNAPERVEEAYGFPVIGSLGKI